MKNLLVNVQDNRSTFEALRYELDEMLNNFSHLFSRPQTWLEKNFDSDLINPSIDIIEDDDHYKIEVEMPGMGEEDVKITLDQSRLTIKGEKSISKKDADKNYISREIGYGYYERIIGLPEHLDTDKAKATFKKGMLWITIPKKTEYAKKKKELKIEKVA